MEKGFRRISFTLIILSLVTAGIAGVYLWYNFNARSALTVIVPENAYWMYHFQTKKTEKSVAQLVSKGQMSSAPAPFMDSLRMAIQGLPVFSAVSDPAEPGLTVRSDVVIWQNPDGWFLALSVSSEPRLKEFCSAKIGTDLAGKLMDEGAYYWLKAKNRNIYFAFKHKACVLFIPADTAENAQKTEEALNKIFNPKAKSLMENTEVQKLYDTEGSIIFFSSDPDFGFSHAVLFDKPSATFIYTDRNEKNVKPSPLFLLKKAGIEYNENDIGKLMDKNNRITPSEYLNQTFRTAVKYLKPFNQ